MSKALSLSASVIAFSVLSRLKGIETGLSHQSQLHQQCFQCAFPFEGN